MNKEYENVKNRINNLKATSFNDIIYNENVRIDVFEEIENNKNKPSKIVLTFNDKKIEFIFSDTITFNYYFDIPSNYKKLDERFIEQCILKTNFIAAKEIKLDKDKIKEYPYNMNVFIESFNRVAFIKYYFIAMFKLVFDFNENKELIFDLDNTEVYQIFEEKIYRINEAEKKLKDIGIYNLDKIISSNLKDINVFELLITVINKLNDYYKSEYKSTLRSRIRKNFYI